MVLVCLRQGEIGVCPVLSRWRRTLAPLIRKIWVLKQSFSSCFSQDGRLETDFISGNHRIIEGKGEDSGGEPQPSHLQPWSSGYLRFSQLRGEIGHRSWLTFVFQTRSSDTCPQTVPLP